MALGALGVAASFLFAGPVAGVAFAGIGIIALAIWHRLRDGGLADESDHTRLGEIAERPFPFAISVPVIGETDDTIQAQVVILNRQAAERLALTLEAFHISPDGKQTHWYQAPRLVSVKPDLDPQTRTEGTVNFSVSNGVGDHGGRWGLRVSDMVSGRSTGLFTIPGCYPAGRWLTTSTPPTFTRDDQVIRVTTHTAPLMPWAQKRP